MFATGSRGHRLQWEGPALLGASPWASTAAGSAPSLSSSLQACANTASKRQRNYGQRNNTLYNFLSTHTKQLDWTSRVEGQGPYLLVFTHCGVVQRRLTIDVPCVDVGTFKQHTGGAMRDLHQVLPHDGSTPGM